MHEKLTEAKLAEILEAGIHEFAERGMEKASMASIAGRAGISVGVLYKYYSDKESFFLACVRRSVGRLEEALKEVLVREDKILGYADQVICILQRHAAEHGDDIRMYHEITSVRNSRCAADLAEEIEKMTAGLYTDIIGKAQKNGTVREDMDPGTAAFFFDNLLMMLQFGLCCDYYRERWKLYCGGDLPEDDMVREQLLRFLESAFTFSREDVPHEGGK